MRPATSWMWTRRGSILRAMAGIVGVALLAVALRWVGVVNFLSTLMLTLGFDTERAQMLAALLLALLASMGGGAILLRRGRACLGSLAYFVMVYLIPFGRQATPTAIGPVGQPEVLVPSALARVLLSLLALGGLLALAGAVLGEAFGRLVLLPFVTGAVRLVRRLRGEATHAPSLLTFNSIRTVVIGCLVVLALRMSVATVGNLLVFGPSADLYRQTHAAPHQGTVEQGAFPSPALGGRIRQYWIYLPPAYAVTPDRRFPVLYLLHGTPGGPRDWFFGGQAAQTADALIAAGAMRPLIMVTADGNGPYYPTSEWADSWDHRQLMATAVASDLVGYIDLHYRTLAGSADRFVGGLSEGGFGAVNLALNHPSTFGGVFSLGGYFKAPDSPVFGLAMSGISYRSAYSPVDVVRTAPGLAAARHLVFVIGVGTDDHPYYDEGVRFFGELQGLNGVQAHLIIAHGGHAWRVWALQLGEALKLLAPLPLPRPTP